MAISREDLTARLADIAHTEKEAWANLNAVIGARMEVEYWLTRLDQEDAALVEPEEPHDPVKE